MSSAQYFPTLRIKNEAKRILKKNFFQWVDNIKLLKHLEQEGGMWYSFYRYGRKGKGNDEVSLDSGRSVWVLFILMRI